MDTAAGYTFDVARGQCFGDAVAATAQKAWQPQIACTDTFMAYSQPSQTFCVGEPLELDLEDDGVGDQSLGCVAEPFCAITKMQPLKVPAWALSPSTLAKDGRIGSCVRNTFIHAVPEPPTPTPRVIGTASQRSQSVPRNMHSAKDDWEGACNALGFLPQPVESDASASENEAEVNGCCYEEHAQCLPATPARCWPATPARCWPDTPECGAPFHAPQLLHLAVLVC